MELTIKPDNEGGHLFCISVCRRHIMISSYWKEKTDWCIGVTFHPLHFFKV